jgi:hypothetical protein
MRVGERIAGRFELEALAQSGGMGAIWKATDRLTGERVAVKLLRAAGSEIESRFLREALLLSELRHPAIVRHVAHGRTGAGDLYLAMEWLDGEDLGRHLARGPLEPAAALAMLRRVAEGLAQLHARGGVHRDLKPGNVFLEGGRPERAKLLDFGIARGGAATGSLTRTGALLGTPGYTAPEQARGSRSVDARVDVFALGCVLFEALAGRPTFVGDHVMAILAKILLEEAPRIRDAVPAAGDEVDALVARMLDKDPARRPADAQAVVEAIDALGSTAPRPAELAPCAPSLGEDEQRFMSLVMVAGSGASAALDAFSSQPTLLSTPVTAVPAPVVSAGSAPTMTPEPGVTPPDRLAELVHAHGGRLDALLGGSWVVTWAAAGPTATDQAAQAARCALSIKQGTPAARVVLASGRGLRAGGQPVGEAIDRGVRLMAGAGASTAIVGGVRIDELSAGLLAGRFQFEGAGEAEGKPAPVRARRTSQGLWLVSERRELEPERKLLGRATPLVGRDRELKALALALDEAIEEPAARAMLLRAPAGYGKSRLVDEFLAGAARQHLSLTVLRARGEAMRAGSPFALIAQCIARAADLHRGAELASERKKLRARLGRHLSGAELERIAAFLGSLVDVPPSDALPLAVARRDPQIMGDQVRRAWEDWLAAEVAHAPVLLVLDDLHHGDLPSVNVVDASLRLLREQPLLVIAMARPEVSSFFPDLWKERQLSELALPELSRKAATRLAREVLGASADDGVVERVVSQSAGNAFYLEELLRQVAEGRDNTLPGTVLAMAQARLESLGAAARRVLRAGAIFGDHFHPGGLVALAGAEAAQIQGVITELIDREVLVRRPGEARQGGEQEVAFRHALVREAAYALLTEADRTLGHRLAGDWLERNGAGDAVELAEHFARGGESQRAAACYARAAREALAGNDVVAALERAARGLDSGASGAVRGELLYCRAEALRWKGDAQGGREAAAAAMASLEPGSAAWYAAGQALLAACWNAQDVDAVAERLAALAAAVTIPGALAARHAALGLGVTHLYLAGRYLAGDELLDEVEREAGPVELRDPAVQARLLDARAFRAGARAEQGEALTLLEGAASAYARSGDLRAATVARCAVGYTQAQLGSYADGVATLRATLAETDRMGLAAVEAVVRSNLGIALALGGDLAGGELEIRASLVSFEAQGQVRMAAISRVYLAQIRALGGELAAAHDELVPAVAQLAMAPPARAMALAQLARVLIALGRPAEAVPPAQEAWSILKELGGLDEGEILVRLAHAEALLGTGDQAAARAAAGDGAARVEALAAKLSGDAQRRTFMRAVPENAALLALAARLGA